MLQWEQTATLQLRDKITAHLAIIAAISTAADAASELTN